MYSNTVIMKEIIQFLKAYPPRVCYNIRLPPGTLQGLTQSDLSVSLCISWQPAGRRGQRWWRLGPSRSGPQQRTSACCIRESEEGMTVR